MNYDQLRIFIAVAESQSFARAAETLYISHSTTSRSVSALEDELEVELLFREKNSIRLTEPGELLYREGKKLIKKTDSVAAAVRASGKTKAKG